MNADRLDEKYYRTTWMTEGQWRCACLIADVFGGFHHIGEIKERANGVGSIVHQRDLGTFDFSHLTGLVILAHQRCIRASVCTAGMKLEIRAYPRKPIGSIYERHPTLEESIEYYGGKA